MEAAQGAAMGIGMAGGHAPAGCGTVGGPDAGGRHGQQVPSSSIHRSSERGITSPRPATNTTGSEEDAYTVSG